MSDKTIIKSPLNYIGGKYKLLPQILPLLLISKSLLIYSVVVLMSALTSILKE